MKKLPLPKLPPLPPVPTLPAISTRWLIGALVVLIFLVAVQFVGNLHMARTIAQIADSNAKVIDDVGQAKQFVTTFGTNLNEVRQLLLMPINDYNFDSFVDESTSHVDEEAAPQDPMIMVFKAIQHVGEQEEIKVRTDRNKIDIEAYLNANETLAMLQKRGFYLRTGINYQVVNEQGTPRILVDFTPKGNLRITPTNGTPVEMGSADSFEDFKTAFVAMVDKTDPIDDQPVPAVPTPDNQAALFQEKIDTMRAQLEALKKDEGFQAALRKAHVQFVFDPRETDKAFEYDILNPQGVPIQILYISKETGELMMRDPNSTVGSLLNTAISTSQDILALPQILNLDSRDTKDKNAFNVLVAGKNASNVDTIMIANINTERKKITLISIPRDLYYNGRKINSVYSSYGMNEMMRQLSDITGQKISQYILVDMYVFADLIDLVGGVTINLEEDLIDPTYKVIENGKKTTLYYPAGEHKINGTEALRISRSRYTTSDYSRAARQQIILEGLVRKARALGFGDAPTVVRLIKTVLQKTETNLSLDQAARYYFRYQDYKIERGAVMSSGNVLESVPVPIENVVTSLKVNVCNTVSGQEVCQIKSAIYTLQPREGNWDYLKWYIREQLK